MLSPWESMPSSEAGGHFFLALHVHTMQHTRTETPTNTTMSRAIAASTIARSPAPSMPSSELVVLGGEVGVGVISTFVLFSMSSRVISGSVVDPVGSGPVGSVVDPVGSGPVGSMVDPVGSGPVGAAAVLGTENKTEHMRCTVSCVVNVLMEGLGKSILGYWSVIRQMDLIA